MGFNRLIFVAILSFPLAVFGVQTSAKINGEPLAVNGDLTFQHQSVQKEHSLTHSFTQSQLRLWSDFKLQDNLRLHIMLGSVAADPRVIPSFSQTFNNNTIGLMRGYLEVKQSDTTSFLIGKMKNPIWSPLGILWNPNLNPDGFSAVVNQKRSDRLTYNASYSYFVLDDQGSGSAPLVVALQPGITYDLKRNQTLKASFGFYQFENIKGKTLQHSAGTNTRETDGSYASRFRPYVLTAEYTRLDSYIYLPFKKKPVKAPFFSLFGEYVNNTMASRRNQAWSVGTVFGDKDLSKGNSQFTLSYRFLDTDSWLDPLPNILAYGGSTDIRGYQLKYQYAPKDYFVYGVSFYGLDRIHAASNAEHRLVVYGTVKF